MWITHQADRRYYHHAHEQITQFQPFECNMGLRTTVFCLTIRLVSIGSTTRESQVYTFG